MWKRDCRHLDIREAASCVQQLTAKFLDTVSTLVAFCRGSSVDFKALCMTYGSLVCIQASCQFSLCSLRLLVSSRFSLFLSCSLRSMLISHECSSFPLLHVPVSCPLISLSISFLASSSCLMLLCLSLLHVCLALSPSLCLLLPWPSLPLLLSCSCPFVTLYISILLSRPSFPLLTISHSLGTYF